MSPIVQTLIRESYYVICSASHNFVNYPFFQCVFPRKLEMILMENAVIVLYFSPAFSDPCLLKKSVY